MLANYIAVLKAVEQAVGQGYNPTVGDLSKQTGLTYHKVKKAIVDLSDFGFTYGVEKYHRPNRSKFVIDITMSGVRWLTLAEKSRMKGF